MRRAERSAEPIAIVGMDCIFPGARDLRAFWENNVRGVDAIRDIDPERWDPDDYGIRSRRGGFIDGLTEVDPIALGVMPASIEEGDAEQVLVASIVQRALVDASRGREISEADLAWVPRERTDVVIGRGGYLGDAAERVHLRVEAVEHVLALLRRIAGPVAASEVDEIRRLLVDSLAPVTSETVASSVPNLCAGRVTNRLDLMGRSHNVDAACASALVALDEVVRSLQAGRSDLGIAAAVHLIQKPGFWFVFETLGALSKGGTIRPFADDADGLVVGEGLGAIVLKRLADAERDGDRIYAIVRGIGIASDGRGAGIMTPRLEGELLALRRGWDDAGLDPSVVTLIEGHGTAMAAGDETEVAALRSFFPERPPRGIALGSVKSMIGHAMPAAGMAGLIRTALALYHRVRPATLGVTRARADLDGSPFFLATESQPWIVPPETPRVAAVNAFGFGGINAHVVLEEAAEDASPRFPPRDSELFLFSGSDLRSLTRELGRWRRLVADRVDLRLDDLAWTSIRRFDSSRPVRLSIVAGGHAELAGLLDRVGSRLESGLSIEEPDASFSDRPFDGRFAVLFPGIGFPGLSTSYTRRLGILCMHFPEMRKVIEEADAIIGAIDPDGTPLADQFFPPTLLDEEAHVAIDRDLAWSERTAIGILLTHYATWSLLRSLGVAPDALVGFSLGEVAALMAADAIDLDPAHGRPEVVRAWRAMKAVGDEGGGRSEGLWAMVAAPSDRVETVMRGIDGTAGIAMDATPGQVIVAGEAAAVREILSRLRGEGIWSQELPQLPFLLPFLQIHTDLARKMTDEYGGVLGGLLDRLVVRAPRTPVWSGADGKVFPNDSRKIRDAVAGNIVKPVRIRPVVESLWNDGFRLFLTIGAGRGLLHNVRTTLGVRDHVALALDQDDRDPLHQVQSLVGRLAVMGVAANAEVLFRDRPVREIDPDSPPVVKVSNALSLAPPRFRFDDPTVQAIRRFVRAERDEGQPVRRFVRAAAGPIETIADGKGTLGRVFEEFLSLEEEIERNEIRFFEQYLDARAQRETSSVKTGLTMPLTGTFVRDDRDGSRVSRLVLDLDEHRFLADHVLLAVPDGLKPAEDLLPTLPLTFGAEIMAESASSLMGSGVVKAIEDVSASRWIPLDGGRRLPLQIRVTRIADDRAAVEIAVEGERRAAMAGVVVFGVRGAPPEPMDVDADRACLHSAAEYYEDGPLFHGEGFHVLRSLDGVGSDAAVATIGVVEFGELFASEAGGSPIADPMVVDGLGQILGYRCWLDGRLVLPVGFRTLRVFGERPPGGACIRGAMAIRSRKGRFIEADLEALGPSGRPWIRVEGWRVWRVIPPRGVMGERRGSREIRIARQEDGCAFAVAVEDLGNIEPSWVARVYLSVAEWTGWREDGSVRRLLDFVAAKDAARTWFSDETGVVLHPLEVRLTDAEDGGFVAVASAGKICRVEVTRRGDESYAVASAPANA